MPDIDSARRFVQLHGRLLDRRRFDHLIDGAGAGEVVSAVSAYANPDGGYAGLIEPDVRTTTSQPVAALTAFEVLHETGAQIPRAAFGWLAAVSHPDGGLPFSLPTVDDAPHAPWMAPSTGSSLHMTAAVTSAAVRSGADHPWIDTAAAYCRGHLDEPDSLSAYELKYAIDFLDAVGDEQSLARLRERLPEDGRLPVAGGVEGETLTLLDLAPRPEHRARRLFDGRHVEAALDELERRQRDDGGWDFDWLRWSALAAFEWRARLTVDALVRLRANGR